MPKRRKPTSHHLDMAPEDRVEFLAELRTKIIDITDYELQARIRLIRRRQTILTLMRRAIAADDRDDVFLLARSLMDVEDASHKQFPDTRLYQ